MLAVSKHEPATYKLVCPFCSFVAALASCPNASFIALFFCWPNSPVFDGPVSLFQTSTRRYPLRADAWAFFSYFSLTRRLEAFPCPCPRLHYGAKPHNRTVGPRTAGSKASYQKVSCGARRHDQQDNRHSEEEKHIQLTSCSGYSHQSWGWRC